MKNIKRLIKHTAVWLFAFFLLLSGTAAFAAVPPEKGEAKAAVGVSALEANQEITVLAGEISTLFPDPVFAQEIASQLGKTVSYIPSPGELATITKLNMQTKAFLDWTGISLLTGLEDLDLGGNAVAGTLGDLPTSIIWCNISAAPITGTLSTLSTANGYTVLRGINFFNCPNVTGAMADLNDLTTLTNINLSLTQISGDIGDLASHPNITNFEVLFFGGMSNVSGSVAGLAAAIQLDSLMLNSTPVTGDIGTLSGLVQLTMLSAYETDVTGNISVLANMPLLEFVDLGAPVSGPGVSGSLASLAGFTHLKEVYLDVDGITGGLANFSASSLSALHLSGSGITGSLADLQPNLLQVLSLQNTSVTGNVSVTGTFSMLKGLDLSGSSGINGDISGLVSDLYGNIQLQVVVLSGTGVTGNTAIFRSANAANLDRLELSGLAITGDFADFAFLYQMSTLDLSGTGIMGDPLALSMCQGMQNLGLNDLKINLDTLLFFDAPRAVPIAVQWNMQALTPTNITGGSAAKQGNDLVWQLPGPIAGTLSYDFSTLVSIGEAADVVFSGTVSQAYNKLTQVYTFVDSAGNPLTLPAVTSAVNPFEFRVNADYNRFVDSMGNQLGGVILNGKELTAGVDFTSRPGSTIISINGSVFKNMPNGTYQLIVYFSDGYAMQSLTLNLPRNLPPAGDSGYPLIMVAVALLLASGVCGALLWRRNWRTKLSYANNTARCDF
ncbi:MAG: hypothetical protein LBP91_05510 [Coriobacteriales bacterium]|jgi:Leucine-rich repeat (LRR) protein|nr:hypothetical protein [Coriobacteriales bacterium]